MLRVFALLLVAAFALAAPPAPGPQFVLHAERASQDDLELGGELIGVPAGETRYARYEDLLRLPQETHTVSDDTNFPHGTQVTGVPLDELARRFAVNSNEALVVAIADDKYRANYPRDYIADHHPLLVLRLNGKPREGWPPSEVGGPLGPYLISHPVFKPSFKVLSHEDEPQIPYGVVRIEFRRESIVFGAIRPRIAPDPSSQVAQGYIIARQDCFRCHNSGAEGGTKAGRSWMQVGEMAMNDPLRFRAMIHDPKSVLPDAKSPAQPDYDNATLDALTAYFRTFSHLASRPGGKPTP
jgi:hypothetical protein